MFIESEKDCKKKIKIVERHTHKRRLVVMNCTIGNDDVVSISRKLGKIILFLPLMENGKMNKFKQINERTSVSLDLLLFIVDFFSSL